MKKKVYVMIAKLLAKVDALPAKDATCVINLYVRSAQTFLRILVANALIQL
jgi:hypothetical protein